MKDFEGNEIRVNDLILYYYHPPGYLHPPTQDAIGRMRRGRVITYNEDTNVLRVNPLDEPDFAHPIKPEFVSVYSTEYRDLHEGYLQEIFPKIQRQG